jgi:hypothetical protein
MRLCCTSGAYGTFSSCPSNPWVLVTLMVPLLVAITDVPSLATAISTGVDKSVQDSNRLKF